MNQCLRRLLGFACPWLVATLALVSCQGTTTISGEGRVLGVESKVKFKYESGRSGEPRVAVQGDESLAGMCADVTFTDADGEETGSSTHTLDATGGFSVEIPEGSRHMAAVIQDCPEEESPGVQTAESGLLPRVGGPQGTPGAAARGLQAPLPLTRVLMLPVGLEFEPGTEHYYVLLESASAAIKDPSALAASILADGLDARIPTSVRVQEFLTITPDSSGGARIRSATNSDFVSWILDANNGAWTADLFGNSLRYDRHDWDVVETLVPASALDLGSAPGVTYINQLSIRFRSKSEPTPHRTILNLAAQN